MIYLNKKDKKGGLSISTILLIAVAFFLFMSIIMPLFTSGSGKVKYSEIIYKFENHQISSFTLDVGNGNLEYYEVGSEEKQQYKMPYAGLFVENLQDYIDSYNKLESNKDAPMEYNFTSSGSLADFLAWVPIIIMIVGIGFLIYFMMMSQGEARGAMGVGKAKFKNQSDIKKKVTFKDVAGANEEKEELEEIVEFLKNPKKFDALGARIPHGVLLVGPPGTGKTLLARACAGEANVPFYSLSGSDFVELYVGVGASRVRDLFEKAKKTAPSIIFIDEIDAVGRQRGAGMGGGHDEREQTLNQLLVELDGFTENQGVIVIAATNRADILDKALLRPGRFDRQVYVGYPDIKGREEILQVHTKNKPLAPDVDLSIIAKTTVGFTGADLENLVNEAALMAARKGRKAITEVDIEEASIKVVMGPEKRSRVVSDKERKLTAYHETGHAITAYYCDEADPVHQVTIMPRGGTGGFTMQRPQEDVWFKTRTFMQQDIVILLGGRVAEKLIMKDISTGASNDLERATKTARAMVTQYGFSDVLGPVVYSDSQETFMGRDFGSTPNYSDGIASEIDTEIRKTVDNGYNEATKILSDHIDQLHLIAQTLLEREKLDGDEFRILMEGGTIPPLNLDSSQDNKTIKH